IPSICTACAAALASIRSSTAEHGVTDLADGVCVKFLDRADVGKPRGERIHVLLGQVGGLVGELLHREVAGCVLAFGGCEDRRIEQGDFNAAGGERVVVERAVVGGFVSDDGLVGEGSRLSGAPGYPSET